MAVFEKKGIWFIDYWIHGKRKREKIGPSKKLAQAALDKRHLEMAEGRAFGHVVTLIKFRELALRYLKFSERNKSPKSYMRDEGVVRLYLIPLFGELKPNQITLDMVETYKENRSQKVSPRTINIEVTTLKKILNWGVRHGQLATNPITRVTLFREARGLPRYLTEEELDRLLKDCDSRIYPLVAVAAHTGLRKGELLALDWSDIDWKNEHVKVQNKEGFHTKTYESRIVPMNDLVKRILAELPRHIRQTRVFCEPSGSPLGQFRKSWQTALKQAGISSFRFHDLRHHFASTLVMRGVDIRTVKELLGHKDISTTLRYAHVSPAHLKEAISKVNLSCA